MQTRIGMEMQSEKIDQLCASLVKAQSQLKGAVKASENPFFKTNYADLESCWEAAREPLTKNGLCVIQTTDADESGDYLITTLAHLSGQWVRSKLRIVPARKDPQSIGAALTYSRRYALAAIIGLTQKDDDAESVMDRPKPSDDQKTTNTDQKFNPKLYVPYGKMKGTLIKDLSKEQIGSSLDFWRKKISQDNKPASKYLLDHLVALEDEFKKKDFADMNPQLNRSNFDETTVPTTLL